MKVLIRSSYAVFLSFVLVLLAGCGGSSGGSTSTPAIVAAGVYYGSYTMNGGSSPISVYGAIMPNGYSYYGDSQGALYVLPSKIKTGSFSGNLIGYAPVGEVFPNGQTKTTFSVSGSAQDNGSEVTEISGSFSGSGESGDFGVNYQSFSKATLSMTSLAGSYSGYYWGSGSTSIALTLNSNGTFTANDGYGCTISGQLSIVPDYDLVQMQATSTGNSTCVGNVSGLGFVTNTDLSGLFGGASGTYVYVGASNPNVGFVAEFRK